MPAKLPIYPNCSSIQSSYKESTVVTLDNEEEWSESGGDGTCRDGASGQAKDVDGDGKDAVWRNNYLQ